MRSFFNGKTLAGCLAILIAACDSAPTQQLPIQGVVQLSPAFTGEFDLIDQNGDAVRDEDFEGKIMLVYFGFTNCPDVCPGDVGVMSAALNQLGSDASEIAPIFISVDPERDTPQALRDYFAFDDRIIALTGSVEASAAARNDGFKLLATKVPLPDSALEYTIDHQRFFFITDRRGQPQVGVVGGVGPADLAAILKDFL